MSELVKLFSGGKTYAVMAALITYCIIQAINKAPIEEAIVYSLLGAGGITMRAGISKASKSEAK